MAAGLFISFNSHSGKTLDGTLDADSDTIACWLLTSSYTPDVTDAVFSDLSAELSHASYTGGSNGGIALTTKAVTATTGKTYKFSSAGVSLPITGTDATFKYAVFGERNATASSAALMGYIDLNTGGGSVTVIAGNTFTLNCPAAGWFTVTGAG